MKKKVILSDIYGIVIDAIKATKAHIIQLREWADKNDRLDQAMETLLANYLRLITHPREMKMIKTETIHAFQAACNEANITLEFSTHVTKDFLDLVDMLRFSDYKLAFLSSGSETEINDIIRNEAGELLVEGDLAINFGKKNDPHTYITIKEKFTAAGYEIVLFMDDELDPLVEAIKNDMIAPTQACFVKRDKKFNREQIAATGIGHTITSLPDCRFCLPNDTFFGEHTLKGIDKLKGVAGRNPEQVLIDFRHCKKMKRPNRKDFITSSSLNNFEAYGMQIRSIFPKHRIVVIGSNYARTNECVVAFCKGAGLAGNEFPLPQAWSGFTTNDYVFFNDLYEKYPGIDDFSICFKEELFERFTDWVLDFAGHADATSDAVNYPEKYGFPQKDTVIVRINHNPNVNGMAYFASGLNEDYFYDIKEEEWVVYTKCGNGGYCLEGCFTDTCVDIDDDSLYDAVEDGILQYNYRQDLEASNDDETVEEEQPKKISTKKYFYWALLAVIIGLVLGIISVLQKEEAPLTDVARDVAPIHTDSAMVAMANFLSDATDEERLDRFEQSWKANPHMDENLLRWQIMDGQIPEGSTLNFVIYYYAKDTLEVVNARTADSIARVSGMIHDELFAKIHYITPTHERGSVYVIVRCNNGMSEPVWKGDVQSLGAYRPLTVYSGMTLWDIFNGYQPDIDSFVTANNLQVIERNGLSIVYIYPGDIIDQERYRLIRR